LELISKEIRNVFWQTVPQISGNEIKGMVAVLYTTQGLLEMIPGELKGLYRFTLITDEDKVLAISLFVNFLSKFIFVNISKISLFF
jgi:hypothetical protein